MSWSELKDVDSEKQDSAVSNMFSENSAKRFGFCSFLVWLAEKKQLQTCKPLFPNPMSAQGVPYLLSQLAKTDASWRVSGT